MAALFDLAREVNSLLASEPALTQGSLQAIAAASQRWLGDVLGVLPATLEDDLGSSLTPSLIQVLIDTRAELRQAKQYAAADGIRNKLTALGVQLKDTPEGTTWSLAAG